ncbi:MAG: D-alanine--D-alanine ligase family protein [Terriglobales bacterium]
MPTAGKKLRVGLIAGGRSGEHEVSLVSARAVAAHLDRSIYKLFPILITRQGEWRMGGKKLRSVWMTLDRLDVVLPILHGPYGEDGTVQGLLEMVGVPYVGAGVLGSAVAMDKEVTKRLWLQAGLPVGPYLRVESEAWRRSPGATIIAIERQLRYPLFVKPANLGSSVGISKVKQHRELRPALSLAASYDTKLVVEQGLDARELECAVLGNREPQASVPGEVLPGREFYDYTAKYADAGSRTLVPAPVPARVAARVRALALRAFAACECQGLARVDFFLERRTGKLYLNELNTMPGLTSISLYPKLWEAAGLTFPGLLDRLIALARERAAERRALDHPAAEKHVAIGL